MEEDIINHPSHYECESVEVNYRVEPIELCEMCGFLLGSALKYLFRYQHKGKPLEDLKKAQYFLKRIKTNYMHANTSGWYDNDKTAMAFQGKEFFKYCDLTEGSATVHLGLLRFVNEKIDELEAQSVEMGK